MIETKLSIQDFTKYFESNRLGKLHLPNGNSWNPEKLSRDGINVNLRDLFKVMSGWKINDTEVPLDDIVAVIAYGSAVRFPGYEMVPEKRRKFLGLFGPEVETGRQIKKLITPNDVDFFVLTGNDITRHEYIKPGMMTYSDLSRSCITAVNEGGINLINRGIGQLLNGVEKGDTISISAMREGIPIFYDRRLNDVQDRAGITRETPRKIYWDEDKQARLIGRIE